MAEPIAIKHTLHGLRTNYGLTREEVAKYIGIGPNAVTRYEKGAQGMKGVVRDKFARFYAVDQGQIDFDGKHALREEFLAAATKRME